MEGGGIMLIAARNGFAVKRRWKNPYITDGLVAMWDGEWNAGGGKHNPNATVWKDIISDKTLSLANGMLWTNNGLNTNGNHTAMGDSSGIPMKINTIEIVFKNRVRLII